MWWWLQESNKYEIRNYEIGGCRLVPYTLPHHTPELDAWIPTSLHPYILVTNCIPDSSTWSTDSHELHSCYGDLLIIPTFFVLGWPIKFHPTTSAAHPPHHCSWKKISHSEAVLQALCNPNKSSTLKSKMPQTPFDYNIASWNVRPPQIVWFVGLWA